MAVFSYVDVTNVDLDYLLGYRLHRLSRRVRVKRGGRCDVQVRRAGERPSVKQAGVDAISPTVSFRSPRLFCPERLHRGQKVARG